MSTGETPNLPPTDAVCDGGDLDCGSGLLLIIRRAMEPLGAGNVLEVRSREISVREDLPAWCRMVGHEMLGVRALDERAQAYFIRKKKDDGTLAADLSRARDFNWKVRARTDGPMRAKVFARNHSFAVGQPASFDTADAAPSAVEHLLGALAASLLVAFEWRASQASIRISNIEVSLSARAENILVFLGIENAGDPGLAKISGSVFVDADADEEVLQNLWKETFDRCPIARTLLRATALEIEMRTS